MKSVRREDISRGLTVVSIILLMVAGVVTVAIVWKLGVLPVSFSQSRYSIGIFGGTSPFALRDHPDVRNPVLTWKDVSDVKAGFLADPFMLHDKGRWFMFFEVLNMETDQGDIGFAESSEGVHWKYQQIVLDEPFHLSYPFVFKWKEDCYMIPETVAVKEIRLYRAVELPLKWSLVKTLIQGNYSDSSIVRYNNIWWIFTSDGNAVLRLFFAEDLLGDWKEHPKSPLVLGNARIARPAGRPLVIGDRVYRFAQECDKLYGYQVRAFEIEKMTTTEYKEREVQPNPILKPTGRVWNWNGERMHHIDAHQLGPERWIASVDGRGKTYGLKWR